MAQVLRRIVVLAVCAAGATTVASCSDSSSTSSSPTTVPTAAAADVTAIALPDAIRCTLQFRPQATTLDGSEEVSVDVTRRDALGVNPTVKAFPSMTFQASYLGDVPDGSGVNISVTDAGGGPLFSGLYQVTSGDPLNRDFAGGQGFTGLLYVNSGPASLQIWCEAA